MHVDGSLSITETFAIPEGVGDELSLLQPATIAPASASDIAKKEKTNGNALFEVQPD
jgi:hypothetical protein